MPKSLLSNQGNITHLTLKARGAVVPCLLLFINPSVMNEKYLLPFLFFYAILNDPLTGQVKHDYQWIMGYDYSQLPDQIISIDFHYCPVYVSHINTVSNFWMEGSNTSMSDADGNLLFYSNGCYIVNSEGEIMENGDTINPGLIQDVWCPAGGSPIAQGVISLPAPGSDSLYYVFNLDYDWAYWGDTNFVGFAPQRLYYQLIDMSQGGGLGKVVLKNQVALQDTFARANLQAVRHSNGVDWWIITPKSHSNCYFLTLLTAQGIQPPIMDCEGKVWSDLDLQGQSVFSPNATKYARFNARNGLNIFDFDNETGDLSNPVNIEFPNDSFFHVAGVAISSNSRFLYASALRKVYQFDLYTADIAASKILVAEWDGFADPYPTIFYLAALAPDNRIYIAGTSSHKYLHVIHEPDSLGLACEFEQRGVELPSYNFATIPNFPQYRSQPTEVDCDSLVNSKDIVPLYKGFSLYPNPTTGIVSMQFDELTANSFIEVYDLLGIRRLSKQIEQGIEQIDLGFLEEGIYIATYKSNEKRIKNEKLIKIK